MFSHDYEERLKDVGTIDFVTKRKDFVLFWLLINQRKKNELKVAHFKGTGPWSERGGIGNPC